MRRYPNDSHNKECYLEPGELIIWRWLGVDRFFPPRYEETPQSVLRGCSSVSYMGLICVCLILTQNRMNRIIKRAVCISFLPLFLVAFSSLGHIASFKLISIHRFPVVPDQFTVPRLNLYHSPTHDPVVQLVYPKSETILMVNLTHLEPKRRPVYPLDYRKENGKGKERDGTPVAKERIKKARKRRRTLVDATRGLSFAQDVDQEDENYDEETDDEPIYVDDPDDADEPGSPDEEIDKTPIFNGREEVTPPGLEGWTINIGQEGEGPQETSRLMNCSLGIGGRVIVGVGTGSSLWVWHLNLKR